MHRPGESLKQEREARGRTIEEMAEATGLRLHFLTALEEEAFESLPGRGFVKLYIRAYADVLGFDPKPVIEAYDRAIQARQGDAPAPAPTSLPRPAKAALERWRQERMAERDQSDLSEETFDEPEDAEQDPEPEPLEQPVVGQVSEPEHEPVAVGLKTEPEPEPVAVDQETAPGIMEEPTVQTVPLPVESVSPSRPARSPRWPMALLLLLVVLPLVAYLVGSMSKPEAPPVRARQEPVPVEAVAPPPEAVEAPRTPPRTPPPVREQAAPSSLEVAESGVGLRLVGTRLEGESVRFRSGQRVTFVTRVLGGAAGESISHVWLRDGKVEQSIRLRLGGASWRTYSTKTLGRPGAWAVEARDEQGHVLARADLTVAP